MQIVEQLLGNSSFIGRNQALVFHERLHGCGAVRIDGLDEREIEIGVGEVGVELSGQFEMELGQAEIVLVEVEVGEVVMRFDVAWIVFEAGGEAIECFGCVAALGFKDAEVAESVGNAVLLVDGFGVKFGGARVAAFIAEERLLERAEAGGEFQDLRGRCGEEVKLVRVLGCLDFATFADAAVTELGCFDREF